MGFTAAALGSARGELATPAGAGAETIAIAQGEPKRMAEVAIRLGYPFPILAARLGDTERQSDRDVRVARRHSSRPDQIICSIRDRLARDGRVRRLGHSSY